MEFKNNKEKMNFDIKCSQYIGTDKTPYQCARKIIGKIKLYNK